MRERPILFSGLMVRAILEGRKTQTRRVVKVPDGAASLASSDGCFATFDCASDMDNYLESVRCPYGQPGGRLWVREGHRRTVDGSPVLIGYDEPGQNREYEVAGIGRVREFEHHLGGWGGRADKHFPSIHMPRWTSRITLEVTEVRVQRLREIGEEDAKDEGAPDYDEGADAPPPDDSCQWSFRASFERLWDSINAKRGFGWDANPWVWAITFRKVL